jgi:hypothetical protein
MKNETIEFYQQDCVYSNIFLNTFQEKISRKLTLLQKKSTLKLFSRQKKPELKVMIPLTRQATSSTNDSDDYSIKTPTGESFTADGIQSLGYSNFYMKLPNGNWMVRMRDNNRKIIGTYEIDGSMI